MISSTPQHLAQHALALTTSPECIAIVNESTSANLRWANNTLTTNGVMESTTVTVIAFDGARTASVTGAASTPEEVARLVAQADQGVLESPEAEDCNRLISGPASTDWDEPPGATSIDVYADFASTLGDSFLRAHEQRRILYGFVNHEVTTTYLASSTGLRLRHEQPTGHYACTGKTSDLQTSAWVGGATRDFRDVDAAAMDAELVRRLGWAQRNVDLPAGRYDTILPPTAVADLMIDVYWSAGARVAHEGQSVFSQPGGGTKIGQRLVRPGVRLWSDPARSDLATAEFVTAAGSSNESSVFDNGAPLRATDWISDGVLTSLLQTRHSATITGQPLTPMIDNLILDIDGASGDPESLVAGVERGLLLTCLWYIREVDPQTMLLTGLTRDGVYLIEGGEITGAVNNFRFNESPIDLLRRFTHASGTVAAFSREWGDDYFSRTRMPALRVPDFNMSSVSPAR